MSDNKLVSMGNKSFEDLKKTNEYGAEYWTIVWYPSSFWKVLSRAGEMFSYGN